MSSMVEPRIEIGTCEMGNVFVFHFAEKSETNNDALVNDTWQVRAGNHTVGTYGTAEGATRVANALCGIEAPAPAPAPEPTPEPVSEPETVTAARGKAPR